MNQNHCSKMGLTSHLSNAYDAFSSLCASFFLALESDEDNSDESDDDGSGSGLLPSSYVLLCFELSVDQVI